MHETSDFFYSILTFSYNKYFVHSYTVDVVFTLSYYEWKLLDKWDKRALAGSKMQFVWLIVIVNGKLIIQLNISHVFIQLWS